MQSHQVLPRLRRGPSFSELTPDRVAALRRNLGKVMDDLVLRMRPDTDDCDLTDRVARGLSNVLTSAAALGILQPKHEAEDRFVDVQEVWVQADRCLVEAYSRALCGNTGAARAATTEACRAVLRLEAALRQEQACSEVVPCTSTR